METPHAHIMTVPNELPASNAGQHAPAAVSGASMDTFVPRSRRRQMIWLASLSLGVLLVGIALWRALPQGLQVSGSDLRVATVERGTFLDNVIVRANAIPQNAVILDAIEAGRVEEVHVRDGALLEKGEPLFRLSNAQRQLELLARQSDHATQIANLSNLRVAFEAGETDHERRLSDLAFKLEQARKLDVRNRHLAERGFISTAALEDSDDKLAQLQHDIEQERVHHAGEMTIKRDSLAQMEQATARLNSGLALMNASIDALTVRAPAAGRLTDFHLQVGEGVTQNQHIGRIDDPLHFKLQAEVDEYYLSRIAVGQPGRVRIAGAEYAVKVGRVYPQIDKGRFSLDMQFTLEVPKVLNPGQSVDVEIALGDPVPALVLPAGEFVNDGDGSAVFLLDADGKSAERRAVRIGRRSNSQVEVTAGLAAGDKVIVSSYAGFGHATRLQVNK